MTLSTLIMSVLGALMPTCREAEPLAERIMEIAIQYDLSLIAPSSYTDGVRAPATCYHSYAEAMSNSLPQGTTFELMGRRNDTITIVYGHRQEWRLLPDGEGGHKWYCVPTDVRRRSAWRACHEPELELQLKTNRTRSERV